MGRIEHDDKIHLTITLLFIGSALAIFYLCSCQTPTHKPSDIPPGLEYPTRDQDDE